MFFIIRMTSENTADYFGPFPTKERAKEYAASFGDGVHYAIEPIIVPNCVSVKVNY